MKEEVGTEKVPSDATRVDVNLFGDAAEDPVATATGDEGPTEVTERDDGGPQAVDNGDADGKAAKDEEPDAETGEASTACEKDSSEELKVVLSIRDGRATIGVQRPSSDPHIESFDDADLAGLAQEAPGVVERARARWEQAPKYPSYVRPAPAARRRTRRGGGSASGDGGESSDTLQQALTLF